MSRLCLLCLLVLVVAVGVLVPGAAGSRPGRKVATSSSLAARSVIEWRRPRRASLPLGMRAVRIALREVGTPYRWGGSSPGGFDCSGLVMWAYGRLGVTLPHHAATLARLGRRVSRRELRPGDLVFFSGYGHVGLYIGRGRMVHAPETGTRVRIERLVGNYGRRLVEARRLHA
jgi:uncharacterized protein YycO